jgi:hypothetical protein
MLNIPGNKGNANQKSMLRFYLTPVMSGYHENINNK